MAGWLQTSCMYCHVPRSFFVGWVPSLELRRLQPPSTHTPTPAAFHAEVTRLLGCQIDPASRAGGIGCSRGRCSFQDRSSAGHQAHWSCASSHHRCASMCYPLFYCAQFPSSPPGASTEPGLSVSVCLSVFVGMERLVVRANGPSHRASNCRSRSVASGRSHFCATSACLCIRAVHVMRVDVASSIPCSASEDASSSLLEDKPLTRYRTP
jgi:hypothetical protein